MTAPSDGLYRAVDVRVNKFASDTQAPATSDGQAPTGDRGPSVATVGRRSEGGPVSEGFHRRAVIGGVITVAASIVPFVGLFAPALGGGIAAWLAAGTDDDGAMLGAAAGLVGAAIGLPVLALGAALATGTSTAALLTLPLLLLVMTAYMAGLGAVGGFAGERLSASTTPQENTATTPGDAVGRLQKQYVDGDMTEPEFERRLERLIDEEGTGADLADADVDVDVDVDVDTDLDTDLEETTALDRS